MGTSTVRSRPRFKESGVGEVLRLCAQSWVTGWVGGRVRGGMMKM